jgi:haloalkane dehalogenase
MMVWGMKDWCFRPECLDRLQQHWPQAEVHEMANAGHYVIEDESEQVQQLVEEFLSRHRA